MIQALGGQVNANQGNQASEVYLKLTLAGRQRHSTERCHLITARGTLDGGSEDDQAQVDKVPWTPKKSQVLAQVGRGHLGTVPDAPGWQGERPPQLG